MMIKLRCCAPGSDTKHLALRYALVPYAVVKLRRGRNDICRGT